MDKEAFVRGYEAAMCDFRVKSAKKDSTFGIPGLSLAWDTAKYPLAIGTGAGLLAGVLGNYTHSQLVTPTDADLEILENKALAQEARRQSRGLRKLQLDLAKEQRAARRPMRTGL